MLYGSNVCVCVIRNLCVIRIVCILCDLIVCVLYGLFVCCWIVCVLYELFVCCMDCLYDTRALRRRQPYKWRQICRNSLVIITPTYDEMLRESVFQFFTIELRLTLTLHIGMGVCCCG